jgi:hypothetical protein
MAGDHGDVGDALRRAVTARLAELVAHQETRVRVAGRRIVPTVTLDDLLSPDDVPALRADPEFLYEDGVLAGLLAAETAIRALFAEAREGRPPGGPGRDDAGD